MAVFLAPSGGNRLAVLEGVLALLATAVLLVAEEAGEPNSESTAQPSAQPPLVTADGAIAGVTPYRVVGAQADVGLPDGAGVSLLVMPLAWLRLHLGGLATISGSGIRAGISTVAFPASPVRPFVGCEAGYGFTGSAKWLPLPSSLAFLSNALEHVSYGWATAHAGFEFGSASLSFVIRGGLSYVDFTFAGPRTDVGGAALSASSMSLRGVIPSGRVGLQMTFF